MVNRFVRLTVFPILAFIIFASFSISTTQAASTCSAPLGSYGLANVQYRIGSSLCVGNTARTQFYRYTCDETNGFTIKDLTLDNCKQECVDGDLTDPFVQVQKCDQFVANPTSSPSPSPSATTTPIPTPDPSASSCNGPNLDGGQLFPVVGYSCGMSSEIAAQKGEVPGTDSFNKSISCCYSVVQNIGAPKLACIFENFPGNDTILEPVDNMLASLIDKFPLYFFGSQLNDKTLTLGKIKTQLAQMPPCLEGLEPNGVPGSSSCTCGVKLPTDELIRFCGHITTNEEQQKCKDCLTGGTNEIGKGVWTGVGCVNISDESSFIQNLLGLGVSLGGGLSLLCLMYASFTFQRSAGNPEAIKKSRELITSCIMGLLLIIFSVFILRLIGYTILRIPGFS